MGDWLFFGKGTAQPVRQPADVKVMLPPAKQHHYRCGYSMALAAEAWGAAGGRLPPGIARAVGSDAALQAHVEYPVPVWGGGISMTDVLAVLSDAVIAVEAKMHEFLGPRVADWIAASEDHASSLANKQDVVRRYAAAFGVPAEALLPLRYQLLHRTLAAALAAKEWGRAKAWMIVQSFGPPDPKAANRIDYDAFVALVGAAPVLEGVPVRLAWVDEATPCPPTAPGC